MLLDEFSALLGDQLEGRGWYLVRFGDIDTVYRTFELKKNQSVDLLTL